VIKREIVDKIIETARIEEVVGDFVTLKKRGVNLLGVCPFHNEKTPSFTVSVPKGIYKCFGCGKGGNSVNFIMDHEQMTYPDALRYLARKYNIELEEREFTPEENEQQQERESLFIVSGFAQKYFTDQLHNTDLGKSIGLGYFKEREIRPDIIEKFQLGYNPDQWRALTDAAIQAGYKLDYLIKAGLTIQSERGEFDRFMGRVMFPIHSITGRVIAFGGRVLKTDKKTAKYINSPETPIYHKSNILYGIFFAKKKITEEDNCYLVEGYTDVIALHQAGIENVVASSGTALTVEQIRLIRRYTKNITILYDGDAAGIKASFRGIDLILEEGMNVKVLLFPDGDDPDSFSRKVNTDELKTFIKKNSKDFISFKTSLLVGETENDPIKKASLIKDIVASIAIIPEAITRSVYVKECSRIMQIDEQVLLNELGKLRRNKLNENQKQQNGQEVDPVDLVGEAVTEELRETIDEKCEHLEKDIIRLLLNYGGKEVFVDGEDEDGKPAQAPTSVAELIISELENDAIEFENPVYKEIYKVFSERKGEVIPSSFFTNHERKEISELSINLISSPYSLSDNWEKHGIQVETEEHHLKKAVLGDVYALKAKKLEIMSKEIDEKIKNYPNDEILTELLEMRMKLDEAKKTFNRLLGRIVVK